MTKMTIAIGIGLLISVGVPAQDSVADDLVRPLFITGGAAGEAVEVDVRLVVSPETDCDVDVTLVFRSGAGDDETAHAFALSKSQSHGAAVHEFGSARLARTKVEARLHLVQVAYAGPGRCDLYVSSEKFDMKSGGSLGQVVIWGDSNSFMSMSEDPI